MFRARAPEEEPEAMADLVLNARPRDIIGKQVGQLRRAGVLPAVVYGPAMPGPSSIQLDYKEFAAVYSRAGRSKLITLTIGDQPRTVFIREVQYNMLRRRVDHVDFYAAQMDVETTVSVPVVLVGEAPISRSGDAVVNQVLETVMVRALPRAIPGHLEVDAGRIATVDDDVRVGDLSVPSGVTIVDNPEAIVVSVTRSRLATEVAEEEAVTAEEVAASQEPTTDETDQTGEAADTAADDTDARA
jgi:large subunit ribosomal protein L25